MENTKFKIKKKLFDDFWDLNRHPDVPLNGSAESDFLQVIEILNLNKINYFIADGTLLGFFRDGGFISHDNDIDFYLTNQSDAILVKELLLQSKFKPVRILKYDDEIFQIIFLSEEGNLIDFCIWKDFKNNLRINVTPEIRKPRFQPKKFFESKTYLVYKGIEIPTFSDPSSWLQFTYGDMWMVPNTEKKDWRIEIKDYKKTFIDRIIIILSKYLK